MARRRSRCADACNGGRMHGEVGPALALLLGGGKCQRVEKVLEPRCRFAGCLGFSRKAMTSPSTRRGSVDRRSLPLAEELLGPGLGGRVAAVQLLLEPLVLGMQPLHDGLKLLLAPAEPLRLPLERRLRGLLQFQPRAQVLRQCLQTGELLAWRRVPGLTLHTRTWC
jgi:hypothetical protein